MRFALWTCCLLIFAEKFFLSCGYSLDRTLEINSYSDYRKSPEAFSNNKDESGTSHRTRLAKINNFIKEKFGSSALKGERIRHGRHENSVRRKSANHPFDVVRNQVDDTNEPQASSEKITSRFEHIIDAKSEEKMSNDDAHMSPTSRQKIQDLGTNEKVKEKFQSRYGTLPTSIRNPNDEKQKALKHYNEMKEKTECKSPTPKLVKVDDTVHRDVYEDVLKNYFPSCTIIHQCLKDSGCCAKGEVCAPKKIENVTLHFKVAIRSRNSNFPKTVYESLSFSNHTECYCSMPEKVTRDFPPPSLPAANFESSRKNADISHAKRCRCPTPFSIRFTADGTCACDCYDKQIDCLRFKEGLEYFSFSDKYCIISHQCAYPTCNFGNYVSEYGRCPKNNEKHSYN